MQVNNEIEQKPNVPAQKIESKGMESPIHLLKSGERKLKRLREREMQLWLKQYSGESELKGVNIYKEMWT